MNVNLSAMQIYKSNAISATPHESGAPVAKADTKTTAVEKLDTISISREAADRQFVGKLARGVLLDMGAVDSAVRTDVIAEDVAAGTYFVDSADVADAILSGVL